MVAGVLRRLLLNFLPVLLMIFLEGCLAGESKFVILICSYNNANYVKKNIYSAVNQNYNNFRVVYIDDASTDGTCDILKSFIHKNGWSSLVTVIKNETRKGGALANHYYAIHQEVLDNEIVLLLDGDDCLANRGVLTYLDRVYSHPNQEIWMTYGQFRGIQSGELGFCCQYPADVIRDHTFRQFVHFPSHLKTFYAWLFKKIKKEDLLYKGDFYKMTGDLAITLPLIEMAKNHYKFIPEVLYWYNEGNPISDHQRSWDYQMELARYIRNLEPYQSLD
jgi:glycosyltransferase involved in cell wall biosynthesis